MTLFHKDIFPSILPLKTESLTPKDRIIKDSPLIFFSMTHKDRILETVQSVLNKLYPTRLQLFFLVNKGDFIKQQKEEYIEIASQRTLRNKYLTMTPDHN